jgi:hypothetical protein
MAGIVRPFFRPYPVLIAAEIDQKALSMCAPPFTKTHLAFSLDCTKLHFIQYAAKSAHERTRMKMPQIA